MTALPGARAGSSRSGRGTTRCHDPREPGVPAASRMELQPCELGSAAGGRGRSGPECRRGGVANPHECSDRAGRARRRASRRSRTGPTRAWTEAGDARPVGATTTTVPVRALGAPIVRLSAACALYAPVRASSLELEEGRGEGCTVTPAHASVGRPLGLQRLQGLRRLRQLPLVVLSGLTACRLTCTPRASRLD
jgi:hypothetical protein